MYFYLHQNSYIAIIGDIKNSKKIKDREVVQHRLKSTLQEINQKYEKDITSKFMVTLGDEFQGLLCEGRNTMFILSEIERKMYPVKIRFGIGIGRITTEINHDMAIGADGPAYYSAREAIVFLKEKERRKQTDASDIRLEVDSESSETTIMINTILSLMHVIKEKWSDRQKEIIWDILEHRDNQADAARRLDITQPSVQKSLSGGKYYAYKEAMDNITLALGEIGGTHV